MPVCRLRMKDFHHRFPVGNIRQVSGHPEIYSMPLVIRCGALHCERHPIAYCDPRLVCVKCYYRKRSNCGWRIFIRLIVNHLHGRTSLFTDRVAIPFYYPHGYVAPVFVIRIFREIFGWHSQRVLAGGADGDCCRAGVAGGDGIAPHFYIYRQVSGWRRCHRYDKCGTFAFHDAGRT